MRRRRSKNIVFLDIVLNGLLCFIALFILAYVQIRPEVEESAFVWLNHEDDSVPENAKALPRGVFFEDVDVAGKQKKQEGVAEMRFFANGSVERCLIHVRDGKGRTFTLEVHPLTGRVEVHETYIDQTRA